MCGICGFSTADEGSTLERMNRTIVHRGPDQDGFHRSKDVALAMRRLAIVDVENGAQPVYNEDRSVVAVFNGEIYNHVSLRRELEERGHRFNTDHSDSETIVHAYEEFGLDFANHLQGMFAIALWDGQRLVLVRDRCGVKPLFTCFREGQLVFASEIKALLQHPVVPKRPGWEGLYHYFSLKSVPAPHTAFEHIHALPPGHLMVLEEGALKTQPWWEPDFTTRVWEDEEEVKQELLQSLDLAVQDRMRCDVPFGAYLSGGVDSSAVVALMCRHADHPVKTFSLGYETDLANKKADLHHAREVSKLFGTDHHEYIMGSRELVDTLGEVIDAFDQPFSGVTSTYFLSKLISQHVKVAISGDGADELFASYLTHRTAMPMVRYSKWVRGEGLAPNDEDLMPMDRNFLHKLITEGGHGEAEWRHALHVFTDRDKEQLLRGALGEGSHSTLAWTQASFESCRSNGDALGRLLEHEYRSQFPDQVLAFVDFLSMAHSVEVRSPFIDLRMVELASSLPAHMKIHRGRVKSILKDALRPVLPASILDRPKEGFVLPVNHWLQSELMDDLLAHLEPGRLQRHGLFDPTRVREWVQGLRDGRGELAAKVLNLIMFQVWWERNF